MKKIQNDDKLKEPQWYWTKWACVLEGIKHWLIWVKTDLNYINFFWLPLNEKTKEELIEWIKKDFKLKDREIFTGKVVKKEENKKAETEVKQDETRR